MQRGIPESGEQGEEQRTQEGGQALAQVPVPRVTPVVYSWDVYNSCLNLFILPIWHRGPPRYVNILPISWSKPFRY